MTIEFSHHVLSFSKKLFLSVIILFLVFATCFIIFQYRREKEYKIELLNTQLQNYNDRLNDYVCTLDSFNMNDVEKYVDKHNIKELRVTVISNDGNVLYDNIENNPGFFNNHLNRKEIKEALYSGTGYSINRVSESLGKEFFYSAKYYPSQKYIIRSAMPYSVNLVRHLKADPHFIWFTLTISIILIIIFYRFTHKLGTSITRLQEFALQADKNQPIDVGIQEAFPKNELGEISQHIIKIYRRLHKAKEDLYIEREKLFTHLQISHEGLGVFTRDKKEILVNSQFTQYINIMSDKNLSSSEEIFCIPEFEPIVNFINHSYQQLVKIKEERRMSMQIDKNGRIFSIECIIFQDNSFEISINDITQEVEQARLKKQLTQNIAHELKTPVSSIQGYLETIINNPGLSRDKIDIFLDRSYAQSNRLTHLLRDISVLTRMEEAPGMIEKEAVNITDMVGNIINEIALDLENKNIKVRNLISKDLVINGNNSLLYSIFRNLMDNAMAYAGSDITIMIRNFREDEHQYYFSFSDNGIGVSNEHLSRLFERFYRVDKGRSRKLGGTGLGLAIVKNAVILHGGTILAKTTPGGGLEFIFTLSK